MGSGDITDLDAATLVSLAHSSVVTRPGHTIERLHGGLTNQNFVVTTDQGRVVARLAGQSSDLLAIDRRSEYQNCLAAAATGVAPAVLDFQPDAGVLVVQFIEARTLAEADIRQPAMIARIAASCRQLHGGQRFVSDFDMFALQRRYLDTATSMGLRLPDGYTDFMSQVAELRTVLSMTSSATVPCHNDLLAENLLDDGDRLWLIDFEYSGNNDPCFELGNIASESHLSDDGLIALTESYFGRHDPQLIARTRLQQLMSQYGWTLWGVIQLAASDIDADFWGWSMDKYERAAATFSGDRFPALLRAAAGADP